jgi:hypothetical protein
LRVNWTIKIKEDRNVKCPICGCLTFYVKDPDDEYETYEFDLRDREVVFQTEPCEKLNDDTETYCNNCAWHGQFAELREPGNT